MTRKGLIITLGFLIGTVFMAVLFLFWAIRPITKPAPNFVSTKILDRDGGLLYEVSNEMGGNNTFVSLAQIPSQLQQAVIAAEDSGFYEHHGIAWSSLGRAVKNIIIKQPNGGASTIEQQLIKNLYFSGASRSIPQKLREMAAAGYWSRTHSKQESLGKYLNVIFLGNRTFGMAAAAQAYFHKNLQDLTLAESALLAGIISAPSKYEPIRHFEMAKARQKYVLERMLKNNFITADQKLDAENEAIKIFSPKQEITAPHFVFQVLEELETKISDVSSGGYTIKTTLDPELQEISDKAIWRRLTDLARQNVNNAALVALDPQTGDILAYIGSKNYFNESIDGSVDMIQAKRQPGSALKPFLYLDALMNGMTPATVIADLPVRFEDAEGIAYYPKNYSYRYFGPVTLRDALGSSLNIPAVKILNQLGLSSFFGTLERFGLKFEKPPAYYGLSAVLGGGEVKFIELARAYAGLALYSQSVEMRNVLEIRNAADQIIYAAKPPKHAPIFNTEKSTQASALIADILSDKIARSRSFGEENLLNLDKKIAVKTGTTRDFHDNWAFGYTPDFVLGVWVGNADNSPMFGVSGISGAVPIWHDIMRYRFSRTAEIAWPKVELTKASVCLPSGLLSTEICPKQRLESFLPGTEPQKQDDWYRQYKIDQASGRLANNSCSQNVVEKTFLSLPPEYHGWEHAKQTELPPTHDCRGNFTGNSAPIVILSPLDGDVFEISNLINLEMQKIPFIAGGLPKPDTIDGPPKYRWIIDGRPIESDDNIILWSGSPGEHILELEGANQPVRFIIK